LVNGLVTEKIYNKESVLVQEKFSALTGEALSKKDYSNSNEKDEIREYSGGGLVATTEILKNREGKQIKKIMRNNLNVIVYSWILDEANLIITEKEFDPEGNLFESKMKYLSQDGKVIREVEDDEYETRYEYSDGKLIKVKIIEDGQITLEEVYEYNEDGHEIRSKGFDKQTEELVEVKKTYGLANTKLKEEEFVNGELVVEKEFQYDSQNQLVKKLTRDYQNREVKLLELERKL